MSIGAPAVSQYPQFNGTAPDSDQEIICPGARMLQMQISNNAVLITFGHGRAGAVIYDTQPEEYLPVLGPVARPFDAFKIRAAVPSSQLPDGALQAFAILTPR